MTASADTIYALSSAPGRAGVSVFRVSGPRTVSVIERMTGRSCPKARMTALRTFQDGDRQIDSGLVIYMPGPASFTGEDVAELHSHGSLAVIEAMGAALARAGARQAQAGEFTRRAVLNGKMDLTEAEGLADLIDSETEGQRVQALKQMQGGLRGVYEGWRVYLIDALAMVEGEIDFPDEGDVPEDLAKKAGPPLRQARLAMETALATSRTGERIRAGLDITILGQPNAGKSSLINMLAGRDAAIVSSQAGTTRDIVDVQMVLGGLPVRLSDTAGLRHTADRIEAEGVRRATERSAESDIRIYVQDVGEAVSADDLPLLKDGDAFVWNKMDSVSSRPALPPLAAEVTIFEMSVTQGVGVDALSAWLDAEVTARFGTSRIPGLTRARHKACVERGVSAITRAESILSKSPEMAGEDIRIALHAIRELAGETDMDAVFDAIFSRFCIGK